MHEESAVVDVAGAVTALTLRAGTAVTVYVDARGQAAADALVVRVYGRTRGIRALLDEQIVTSRTGHVAASVRGYAAEAFEVELYMATSSVDDVYVSAASYGTEPA